MERHNIEFDTSTGKFLMDNQPLKYVTSFNINYDRPYPQMSITAECNVDIKGMLISKNAEVVNCMCCGKTLCYATNGEVQKILCKSCNKVNKSKQLKLMKRLKRLIEIREHL